MDKENPNKRIPQKFINKVGKIKADPKANKVNIGKVPLALKELIKRLGLNPVCPEGLKPKPRSYRELIRRRRNNG